MNNHKEVLVVVQVLVWGTPAVLVSQYHELESLGQIVMKPHSGDKQILISTLCGSCYSRFILRNIDHPDLFSRRVLSVIDVFSPLANDVDMT